MAEPASFLFLNPSDDAYGADRVLLSLVDAAREDGAQVRVLLPDDMAPGWLSAELTAREASVRRVPLAIARRRYLTPRRIPGYVAHFLRARKALIEQVRETQADVVHVNTSVIPVAATLGRRNRPRAPRVVWHVHELIVSPWFIAWTLRNVPMWFGRSVITNSDAVSANLGRAWVRRASVHRVHNGIASRPSPNGSRPDRPAQCVFVGRLNRWKGYELFVEAAAELSPRFPDARFAVAGEPPVGEEWRARDLRRRITEARLESVVDALGHCDDVPALLDRSHVAVVPSVWPEPFGLVIIEAMRSGCAVVASNHGAAAEIITNGVDGLLVEPGDASALSEAIARLLGDRDLRGRISARAALTVERRFTDQRFRDDVRRVWRNRDT